MFIFYRITACFLPETSGNLHGDKDNLELDLRSRCAPENYVSMAFDLIYWITRASRRGDKIPSLTV